jgi:hypothetical protein
VKVVYVIDTLEIGGAEKSLMEIASRFHKYNPTFVTLFKGNTLKPAYEKAGLQVISLNLDGKTSNKGVASVLKPVLTALRPAIIHATLFRSNQVCRMLKDVLNVPLINSIVSNSYSIRRYLTFTPVRAMKHLFIQLQDMRSGNKPDLYIANSETSKRSASRALF